jgi:hypothetical protein
MKVDLTKLSESEGCCIEYHENLRVPVTKDMLKDLPVGTKVKVVLEGTVVEASATYDTDIRVDIDSLDVSGSGVFEELADD